MEADMWTLLVRNRDYRLLLSAGLISLVGDWILRVGLGYYVYALTGSTLAAATTLLAALLPQIALGSLAGVYVDRWDRRRTMVVTNLALAAGLLPLFAVHDRYHVWIVYLVAIVETALAQFFVAAEAALVPRLVPEDTLVTANALNGQNRDVARLVGAALGGVVAGLGGLTLVTVVDIGTFVVAAGLLAAIVHSGPPERGAGHAPHLLREWAQGARIAVGNRTLRVLLGFTVVTGFGEAVMGTLFAPFVRDVLHGSATAFGAILAVQAAGGIIGGLVAAAVGPRFNPRDLVGYGALAFGVLDLALFLYPLIRPALWPALVLMVLVGLPGAFTTAGLATAFQLATADAYRGRVFGALTALRGAAMLGGALGAGTLGGRIGIVPVIAIQGAGYCLAALLVLARLPRSVRAEAAETLEPGHPREHVVERDAQGDRLGDRRVEDLGEETLLA
jgi:Na+/melibiose symporter-like transporter